MDTKVMLTVVGLSAGLAACGGSSSNTYSSYSTACVAEATDLCNRASRCGIISSGSVNTCITDFETAYACSAGCPSGMTFNSAQASTCINDVNSGACGSGVPTSCATMCH